MGFGESFGGRKDTAAYRDSAEQQKAEKAAQRTKKINLICFVVIIVVFFAYSIFFQEPTIEAVMNDEALGVVTLGNNTIFSLLTDIDSVELHDNLSEFDRGSMQSGTESSSCYSGVYINDAYGEYQLHVNLKVEHYVVIHYIDGILVFNTNKDKSTTELYDNLLNAVNSEKNS